MALVDQLNVVNCGAEILLGTGHQGCTFEWDRVKTIELSRQSYAYTTVQSLANIQEAQQREKIFIISDFESFKVIPVEPKVSTSAGSGDESVDGELPYKYEGMFKKKGVNFWKALRRFNSNGIYNVVFYDINGNKIMTQSKGGIIKGFSTNMIFTGHYKGQEGDTPAEFKFSMQLSSDSIKEMERQTWISGDDADYGINDLEGINDVVLTMPSALTTGATSLVVKATLVDLSHFPDGLVSADFKIKRGTTVITATGSPVADEMAKTYTFTVPAAVAGTYTIETKNAYGTSVILQAASGLMYKSNIASVVCV